MAGLSSPGIGSGLDINGLVSRLMEVEKIPLAALDKKEADYQAKLTAYGTLKSSFSTFQTSVKGLSTTSKFNTYKATAADTSILSASTSSIAKAGSYAVEVGQLAQSHKIASSAFDDIATAVGTGTLTIDFGTYASGPNTFTVNPDKTSKSITIDSSNNSLAGIRDAINEAGAGVSASIVNDGDGYRLVISSNDSGSANSLRVLVSGDSSGTNTDLTGLSKLAYDPTASAGAGKNLEQKVAAQNAELTVDGIDISKSSNTISDAITGVTLNLLKASEAGKATTLTVSRDPSTVKTSVEGFVKAFNDLAATVKDLGGYDFKTQKGGLLLGDTTLRSMQTQMRAVLSQRLEYADGGVSSLSDIGVSFQRDGTLTLNSTKLDAVLADPDKNVAGLFATLGVPSDSLVSYASSTSATKAGRYGLTVSQIATRGLSTGSVTLGGATVITSNVNDALTVKLNGTSATIKLTAGSYTPDQLVAELQSKINSDSSFKKLGYSVTVSQAANILTITSSLYGSASKVEITGGNGVATMLGATSASTGLDVAGTIGGVAATGAGQVLTGSGDASGLKLLIEGGNTGARGTVGFSKGIAWQLDQTLTSLLEDDGTLASRTGGIDKSIEDIDSRRSVLEKRLEQTEKRYRAQFNALDQLVASMQQTSAYLTQQLSALTSSTK